MKEKNPSKELYQRLRKLTCEELWQYEVPRFDAASAPERMATVSVIRAVGVVFSETGTAEQQADARRWLAALLDDPQEKIRRYAMQALPKVGGDELSEQKMLSVLKSGTSTREQEFAARGLEKIGGKATLEQAGTVAKMSARALQRATANASRGNDAGSLDFERRFTGFDDVQILLRVREGLADIAAAEIRENALFRVTDRGKTVLRVSPGKPFNLGDIFELRCFSNASILLDEFPARDEDDIPEAVARTIASKFSSALMESFTKGPVRYRMEFLVGGHDRDVTKRIADRVFALNPALINDPRNAIWTVFIRDYRDTLSIELAPMPRPDPRFAYRLRDVPAASHPPLAACMARLAGPQAGEVVWDPFCGSGLELIERSLLGGVALAIGTDLSEEAIDITRGNFAAASIENSPKLALFARDFRDWKKVPALGRESVSLIITNPPMGRRVPIPDLEQLIASMFDAAATILRPGGRLILANPQKFTPRDHRLKLTQSEKVDLGGFACHLQKYVKAS